MPTATVPTATVPLTPAPLTTALTTASTTAAPAGFGTIELGPRFDFVVGFFPLLLTGDGTAVVDRCVGGIGPCEMVLIDVRTMRPAGALACPYWLDDGDNVTVDPALVRTFLERYPDGDTQVATARLGATACAADVTKDVVLVTAPLGLASPDPHGQRLLAFDSVTGAELWRADDLRGRLSPDGTRALVGPDVPVADSPPHIVDARTGEELGILPIPVTSARFDPSGRFAVSPAGLVVDLDTSTIVFEAREARTTVFGQDGNTLYVLGSFGIRAVDTSDWDVIWTLDSSAIGASTGTLLEAELSLDGEILLSMVGEALIDATDGRVIGSFEPLCGDAGAAEYATLLADGTMVARCTNSFGTSWLQGGTFVAP